MLVKEAQNYLYDFKTDQGLFITLTHTKIEINSKNFVQYFSDLYEDEYFVHARVIYSFNNKTIITILEYGTNLYCQILVTHEEIFEKIKIQDLTKHMNYEVANMVFAYFVH